MKRVLILCTGNSCRSQMAEALWRSEGEGSWESASAGSNPAGYVHPLAIQAMAEVGVDIAGNKSEHIDQYINEPFDLVVTVCDNAADNCPTFPGSTQTLHWPFDDPSHVEGSDEERLAAFRETRELIAKRIHEYLAECSTE